MQRVSVRGADGKVATLAFVRVMGETVYVCPIDRSDDVRRGDEESVVGFPREDVTPIEGTNLLQRDKP